MKLAWYRKYRPDSFEHLLGQGAVRKTLLNALKQGRLSHAYLFAGPRGTGKTSSARLIAKAIQCEARQDDGQACGQCEICTRKELLDLIEIDAASNRGIDEIRELRETLRFAPSYAKAKVYIIDEVHMLTKEAFNALLKSLEEPPENVYFILATTEIHKIPETILSRCQRYDFRRISVEAIVERLQYIVKEEGLTAEPEALQLLAKHADGGMRDAISMLEQFANEDINMELITERLGLTSHQSCQELFATLGTGDTQAALKIIENLHRDGFNLQQFTISFLGLLRNKLHEAVAAQSSVVPKLLNWIHLFDEAWVKLKRASIAQLPLEIAVIRATHGVPAQEKREVAEDAVAKPKTPAPTKRPEGLMHNKAIEAQLSGIQKAIKNPAVRISFQTAKLKEQKGDKLTFLLNSRFHFDKVHAPDAIVAVETALKEVTGKELKVIFELDEGKLVSENPAPSEIDTLGWETIEEAA